MNMTLGQVSSKAFEFLINSFLSHSVNEITVDSLKKNFGTTVLLDVREVNEFDVSHLKNAINIGYNNFSVESIKTISKNDPIVVYCSIGLRSEKIAEKLTDAGYTNVSNLVGGIFEWKNRYFPIYNILGETENIHGYDRVWGLWITNGKKVYTKSK